MRKFDKCLSLKVDKVHSEIDKAKAKGKKVSRLTRRLRQLERRIPT